jgi:polyphosphate kinase
VPRTHPDLARVESSKAANIMAAVRAKDVLVQHPYDSFSTSVQAFIEQAAADPTVLAIKQTLYRTSGDSPIIDALIDAAEAGKQVLAVVEIKARFDEQNNIEWARKLEHSGVHVVYGVVGLKTHCKLSLVVRQEADGLRRYCHVGTGNYHPKTARLYEDYGLFTCDPNVGEDLTRLFNQLSGWAPRSKYKRLLVAPRTVRSGLVEKHRRADRPPATASPPTSASRSTRSSTSSSSTRSTAPRRPGSTSTSSCAASAPCDPGSPAVGERVGCARCSAASWSTAASSSSAGGGDGVFIGSADMMHRNLDRRVEALVSINDPATWTS